MAIFQVLAPRSLTNQARSHIQAQERKEALQLAEHRCSGKSCKNCGSFRNAKFDTGMCKAQQNKFVKTYNICHRWKEKTNA